MPRARIGKLFHLTPLVDEPRADAEYFFNSVFAPLCMMRNYVGALAPARRDLHHRRDVDRADALPGPRTGFRAGGDQLVPVRRALRAARAQHGVLRVRHRRPGRAARRPPACASPTPAPAPPCSATRRTRRGCSSSTRPPAVPGRRAIPASSPTWKAFAESYWPQHPLGYSPHVAHHRGHGRPRRGRPALRRRARRAAAARPGRRPSRAARRGTTSWVRTPWSR